jgi:hypothetical protein
LFFSNNHSFSLLPQSEKESLCKQFILKIDNDIFVNDLYTKFEYTKNKKFSKKDIQTILKDAFQFKSNNKFHLLEQYISDYLGINLYVFYIEGSIINYEKSYFNLTKQFGNSINKNIPNIFLIYQNDVFRPILNKFHENSIFIYDGEIKDIIDSVWNYFTLVDSNIYGPKKEIILENKKEDDEVFHLEGKYNLKELSKLKMSELTDLCDTEKISITKESLKTKNNIKKIKSELIEDLLKL